MEENKSLEEIIADAKAEEEVAKEQEEAKRENSFREHFKEQLREQLKDVLKPKTDTSVTISLDEYVVLKNKELDLDRLLNAMVSDVELNYTKDDLRINGDNVIGAFKALFPEAYNTILGIELDKHEDE